MYQHVLPDDQGQGVIIEDTNHLNKERMEKMCQHKNNKLGENESVFIPAQMYCIHPEEVGLEYHNNHV